MDDGVTPELAVCSEVPCGWYVWSGVARCIGQRICVYVVYEGGHLCLNMYPLSNGLA